MNGMNEIEICEIICEMICEIIFDMIEIESANERNRMRKWLRRRLDLSEILETRYESRERELGWSVEVPQ
jgi:hypothetical protein